MLRKSLAITLPVMIAGLSLWASYTAEAGSQLGPGRPITELPEDQVYPAVAYNDIEHEFLVVWFNDRPGFDDIYAQRVSGMGVLIGPWFPVAVENVERRYPDVAFNSALNEYLVVWEEDAGSGPQIVGQRVSWDGNLLGNAIDFCASDLALATRRRPAVAYASTADKYLVIWERQVNSGPGPDIQGQAVSSDGTPDAACNLIAEASWSVGHERPALAYNRSRNEYLVVWQQWTSDCDVYGRRVQGNGTPMGAGPQAISAQPDDDTRPAVAALPTEPGQGKYLVLYESPNYLPPVSNIYGVRLTGELVREGSVLWLSQFNAEDRSPAVAGQESNHHYLAVWSRNGGVMAREVSLEGEILSENPDTGGDQDQPDVAAGPIGSFLTVYQLDVPGGDQEIFAWMWGTRLYIPLVLNNSG